MDDNEQSRRRNTGEHDRGDVALFAERQRQAAQRLENCMKYLTAEERAAEVRVAEDALFRRLEQDVTKQLDVLDLTFQERVLYSIAISLKKLASQ